MNNDRLSIQQLKDVTSELAGLRLQQAHAQEGRVFLPFTKLEQQGFDQRKDRIEELFVILQDG
jgi:hypothetical protein